MNEQHSALAELDSTALAALVKDIGIPPRPSLLADLQDEVQRDEPRMHVMADIAGGDVAMSAALLKTANSPLMGLRKRVETVQDAFMLLGFQQCHVILTEICLRKLLPLDGPAMVRYWDVSTKRARAMTFLARAKRVSSPAVAHTFGLFVDVGIPLMLRRFHKATPDYVSTLELANVSPQPFTDIERERHQLDHALLGSMVARTWGVSQTVLLATRLHHDYRAWQGEVPSSVLELMALYMVSECIIQRYEGQNQHGEWSKAGDLAMASLGIDGPTLDGWCDEVHDRFNENG
jgi:HD-like signal output (HDOD) protein